MPSQQHHNQGGTLALAHNKLFTCQLDGNDNNTAFEGPPGPEASDLVSGMQIHWRFTHISNSCLSWHWVIQKWYWMILEINCPIFRPTSLDFSGLYRFITAVTIADVWWQLSQKSFMISYEQRSKPQLVDDELGDEFITNIWGGIYGNITHHERRTPINYIQCW